jgi:predicted O-methyltransferase YrrM
MTRLFSIPGRILRALLALGGATLMRTTRGTGRDDLELIRRVRRCAPLLLDDAAALTLLSAVRSARRLGGAMAEAGVYGGGSAMLIAEAKGDAPLHLFDLFEELQGDPGEGDSPLRDRERELRARFGTWHVGRDAVEKTLNEYSHIHLHPGVFPWTTEGLTDTRFSFAHIDLDLYPSTRDALEFFYPRLMTGGIIVGDDAGDPGVAHAFEEYFAGKSDAVMSLAWGQIVVVKVGAEVRQPASPGGSEPRA